MRGIERAIIRTVIVTGVTLLATGCVPAPSGPPDLARRATTAGRATTLPGGPRSSGTTGLVGDQATNLQDLVGTSPTPAATGSSSPGAATTAVLVPGAGSTAPVLAAPGSGGSLTGEVVPAGQELRLQDGGSPAVAPPSPPAAPRPSTPATRPSTRPTPQLA